MTSPHKGLQRDPSYYSSAWKQRHLQLLVSRPQSSSSATSLADDKSSSPASPSGDSLRHILEDYLEIDPASNSAVSQLLSAQLLSRYFRRAVFALRELIFDIDDAANEVVPLS